MRMEQKTNRKNDDFFSKSERVERAASTYAAILMTAKRENPEQFCAEWRKRAASMLDKEHAQRELRKKRSLLPEKQRGRGHSAAVESRRLTLCAVAVNFRLALGELLQGEEAQFCPS